MVTPFSGLQENFVSLGVIDNPLGPQIAQFEKLLDIAGKSGRAVKDARAAFDSSAREARSAHISAIGARSKSEQLSEQGGGTSGGAVSSGGPLPAFLNAMAAKTGDTIGLQCGATITAFLKRSGINGSATSIARSGNARPNADGTYPPGSIFNFEGGKSGYRVNHYATVAPDGAHWLESNWHGKGQTADMITDSRPINWKRDIAAATWGGRRNIGQPPGVTTGKGSGRFRSGASGGESADASDFPDFDLTALDASLSKIGKVDAAWGSAVKSGESNTARFALQTALASKDFQKSIQDAATRTGKSVPEIIKWLRALGNSADTKLNRVRAVDAVTDALKELDKTRKAIGTDKNPFSSILADFDAGGKYAAAPDKQLALLDAQRRLSVAQSTQATKEATQSERERMAVLTDAGKVLNAATIGTGAYDIALEKAQRRFDVWKRPELTGLLAEADTLDKLGGAALRTAKALEQNPFVALKGAAASALATGNGDKGRAAGIRAKASRDAGVILGAQDNAAEYGRAWGRTKSDLETNDALDAQIKALRAENSILGDLTLSETARAAKIERTNFVLDKQKELLAQNYKPADAARVAEGYAVKEDEIKRLTKRNDETRSYTALVEDSARAVKLAQGQTAITRANPGFSPDTERQLAVFEKTQELLGSMEKSDTFGGFDFAGKLKAFTDTFDASAALKTAGAVRGILDEAKQAALTFGDTSVTAGIKFRTAFGDLSKEPDAVKQSLIDATAQVQTFADANAALDAARSQSLDLEKQLETARLGRRKPLSALGSQELDWKYQDLDAQMKNPLGVADTGATAAIKAARDNVRALMAGMAKETKISGITDKIGSAFDTEFDSVLNKQKSWGAALRSGFQDTLSSMASDFVKSQFRNLLTGLFTSVLGGGKTSLAGAGLGALSSGGGIAAGLKAGGDGLFGGSSGSGYGVQLHATAAATGVRNIERDNTLILGHRSELVLNAAQAESYRQQQQALLMGASSGSSNGGGNTYINYGDIRANSAEEVHRQMEIKGRQGQPQRGPRRATTEMAYRGRNALATR